ncbi:MAG: hypothetical protein KC800_03930 [Candidatus Eremiobacteraeota bacterium]|nr:hypothetical protein [Candidatus Eremiobacteraeota bacterium]
MATSLFFLVSIFFLTTLPSAQWAGRKAENRFFAESLLDSEVEKLRALPFGSLELGPREPSLAKTRTANFSVRIEISKLPGSDPELVKQASVVVKWTERNQELQIDDAVLIGRIRP